MSIYICCHNFLKERKKEKKMSIELLCQNDVDIFSRMVSDGINIMEVLQIDTQKISVLKKPDSAKEVERYIYIIENEIQRMKKRIHTLQNIVDVYSFRFQYVTDESVLQIFNKWKMIFLNDIESNRDFLNYFLMDVTMTYLDKME